MVTKFYTHPRLLHRENMVLNTLTDIFKIIYNLRNWAQFRHLFMHFCQRKKSFMKIPTLIL